MTSPALPQRPRTLAEYRDELYARMEAVQHRIGTAGMACDPERFHRAWGELQELRRRVGPVERMIARREL